MPPAATRKAQEIWEVTTEGATWINVKDPRNPEGWVMKRVGGPGSTKRITLSVEEREFNQELVAYENQHLDPFANGLLIRVQPKDVKRGKNELSDAQLTELLEISSDDVFAEQLEAIQSEVILRRLIALAETKTSKARYEVIETLLDSRHHVGKTSRVVKEMQDDDAKYSNADR